MKKNNTTINATSNGDQAYDQTMNEIINFLDCSKGFKYSLQNTVVCVEQTEDKKIMNFDLNNVEKVLTRQDFDGSHFLQVNYNDGHKILITKNLIGFKPLEYPGFDSAKIPKVVTTVDLKSVKKAIEDTYEDDGIEAEVELEVLKKVFQSILTGAETVGFDMNIEKQWFLRNLLNTSAASA